MNYSNYGPIGSCIEFTDCTANQEIIRENELRKQRSCVRNLCNAWENEMEKIHGYQAEYSTQSHVDKELFEVLIEDLKTREFSIAGRVVLQMRSIFREHDLSYGELFNADTLNFIIDKFIQEMEANVGSFQRNEKQNFFPRMYVILDDFFNFCADTGVANFIEEVTKILYQAGWNYTNYFNYNYPDKKRGVVKIDWSNEYLNYKLELLEKENTEIKESIVELQYSPGGIYYSQAKESFEELSGQIDANK